MQIVLWRHSVLTGVVAMAINKTFQLGFIGEEFTAGLIHDIGRSLFGAVAPDDFAKADPLDFEEVDGFLGLEQDVLRTDHCRLGAWFIAQNRLPQALVDVVRWHHSPGQAVENRRLVALTSMADHMANYLQRHGTPDGYQAEENVAAGLLFEELADTKAEFHASAHTVMMDALREACSLTPSI